MALATDIHRDGREIDRIYVDNGVNVGNVYKQHSVVNVRY